MAKTKRSLAGIYMIKNNKTGKAYIGQSKNVVHRFSEHMWIADPNNHANYAKRERNDLHYDIMKYGPDSISFHIICCGEEFSNVEYRLGVERALIKQYDLTNPKKGYNTTRGGEYGHFTSREQPAIERIKRAIPVFLYDTWNDTALLFYSGAKEAGKFLEKLYYQDTGIKQKFSKDIMSHNAKKGSLIVGRYYLIYSNKHDRKEQMDRIIATRKPNSTRLAEFLDACKHVKRIAKEQFKFDVDV